MSAETTFYRGTIDPSLVRPAPELPAFEVRDPIAMPLAAAAPRIWSPMQTAIFNHVASPGGHLVIEALAGSGKTTTILEALCHTKESESALLLAFNKTIATELQAKAPEGVDVMTTHSFGLRAITRHDGRREIEGSRETARIRVDPELAAVLGPAADALQARAAQAVGLLQAARAAGDVQAIARAEAQEAFWKRQARNPRKMVVNAVRQLVSLAKNTMLSGSSDIEGLINTYDVKLPPGDSGPIVAMVQRHLAAARNDTAGPIDFDDMIWLPVIRGLRVRTYDWVFVDERQDLNMCQWRLVEAAAGSKGRIVAVGDRHQAIYGFRGADAQGGQGVVERLKAATLPLSVCYRCSKAVIADAQEIVPAIQAAPDAPDGSTDYCDLATLRRDAGPGDFVISRTKAPLVSLAWYWLGRGQPAVIRGKEIGAELAEWVEDTGAQTMPQLESVLRAWEAAEVERYEEEHRDPEPITDQASCIRALAAGCATPQELAGRIRRLFGDAAGASAIQLMTTHKAKGLEAPRVWMLEWTYRHGGEEDNLRYVAITRAQQELIYVQREQQ